MVFINHFRILAENFDLVFFECGELISDDPSHLQWPPLSSQSHKQLR